MLVGPDALQALRAKYLEMLSLRLASDEDEASARRRMARLAAEFPGALRELDDLTIEDIRARIAALEVAIAEECPSPWMVASARFHVLVRGALDVKRWLGGRKTIDEATLAAFAELSSGPAHEWHGDLAAVARPPRGRLLDLVYGRLASELALPSAEAAYALVFGVSRRQRRSPTKKT